MTAKFYLEGRDIRVEHADTSDKGLTADEAQVVALALIAKAIEELASSNRAATSLRAKQGG